MLTRIVDCFYYNSSIEVWKMVVIKQKIPYFYGPHSLHLHYQVVDYLLSGSF